MSLGSGVRIGRDCDFYAHPRGEVPDPVILRIGDGVHMGHRCNLSAAGSLEIEDKVMMGNDVYIGDHGHEYQDVATAIIDQPVTSWKPVKICRGSWLGTKSVVLPGVTVGEHSVVAAASVVTSDVPPKSVVAGAPARLIKRYDEAAGIWRRVDSSEGRL